jgi:SCY1-like protein 1
MFSGKTVLSMMQPLFFIAEAYLGDKINQEIGETIGVLFTINDRAIRGSLLQKIDFLSQHIDKNTLNMRVFEPACSGFSDSSSTLRELTLKATLQLVPNLTQPNLEKLSRYLVRLQADPESSIRTNTILLFGRLAPHLTEISRQKLLLPAVSRALKDPFVPCRLAALKTTLVAREFFDPGSLATRVLPVVTPQLLDTSKEVRRQSFVLVDDLLFILRQESERMNALPEPTAAPAVSTAAQIQAAPVSAPRSTATAPQAVQQPVASAPSSGGYLSGISSWMASSTKPVDVHQQQQTQQDSSMQAQKQQTQFAQPLRSTYTPAQPLPMAFESTADLSDGWDDDGDLDVSAEGVKSTAFYPASTAPAGNLFAPSADDDDNFFGGFDAKPAKPIVGKKPPSGKLILPAKKGSTPPAAKLAATKLTKDNDTEDGWDDF